MSRKESNPEFFVKSGNADFADRQKSIFGQLVFVDKGESDQEQQRSVPNTINFDLLNDEQTGEQLSTSTFRKPKLTVKRNWSDMKQFQGQESIFKRPDDPPPFQPKNKSGPSIPDYHKNPHKWTKYSLDDVSKEDMSNRSNTAAAFSFLKEIAARKEAVDGDLQIKEPCEPKIAFKRPKQKATCQEDNTEPSSSSEKSKPSFKSSKLVMPEYVVGQSLKRERKRIKAHKAEKIKEITLNHLIAEEEADAE